jgi:hypothetical protein
LIADHIGGDASLTRQIFGHWAWRSVLAFTAAVLVWAGQAVAFFALM